MITRDSASFQKGISITSVRMSKGLEFDEVLIPQPCYVSYVPCAVLAGGVPVVIELEEKDQFCLTPEKLLEKITPT